MFLWSLSVAFPHPVNSNTKEENDAIREENMVKISLEKAKLLSGVGIIESDGAVAGTDVADSDRNNVVYIDDNMIINDNIVHSNNDVSILNPDDDDDNDDDDDQRDLDPRTPHLNGGNTTSGGDANSMENRLLLLSATQIREEMFSIEKRRTVLIEIEEPSYYGTFRLCHQGEWDLVNPIT